MNDFQCPRCLIFFRRKDYLQKHLKRKFPCIELNSENVKKMIPNDTKMIPNDTNMIPAKSELFDKLFKCNFCNELFNNKRSLYRHKNELRCKEMPNKEELKIKKFKKNKIIIKKLEQEKQLVLQATNSNNTTTILNNTNTIINNNITKNNIVNHFNFNIKSFGDENTDFLTKKDKLKIVNRCYMGVPELIKRIHNNPENHNFFISNLKNNVIAILNKENEIEYNDYNQICEQLIEKNMDRLDEYFIEFESLLKDSVKERMQKVISLNNQRELTDKYMEDIKYYLMTISRKNKKDIHRFIDKIENQIKLKK